MIPCQQCGHENPLGTLFCHSCGTRLQVSADQIMGSVAQTQAEQAADKFHRTATSVLTMGLFTLIAIVIVRMMLLPPTPVVIIPPTDPLTHKELFDPAATTWGEAPATGEPEAVAIAWIGPIGVDEEQTVVDWRRAAASQVLDPFGIDFDRLRIWQRAIVEQQNEAGSFTGGDRTAATALAALALQAYPGDPTIDAAAERAREHLRRNLDHLTRGGGTDLARSLTCVALYEADGTGDLRVDTLRQNLLANGKQPDWQSLLIAHLRPADRPDSLVALRQADDLDLLTRANLAVLGAVEPPAGLDALNRADRVDELDGFERLAWAHWQWHHLGDLALLAERLQVWSRTEDPFPAPASLSAITGRHTDFALAVLSCTVPAHAPVQWNAKQP